MRKRTKPTPKKSRRMLHQVLVSIRLHGVTTDDVLREVQRKLGNEYKVKEANPKQTKDEQLADRLRDIAAELDPD